MKLGSTFTLTSGTPTLIANNDGHGDVVLVVKPHQYDDVFIGDSTVTTSDGYKLNGAQVNGSAYYTHEETAIVRLDAGEQLYAAGNTGAKVDVLVSNV